MRLWAREEYCVLKSVEKEALCPFLYATGEVALHTAGGAHPRPSNAQALSEARAMPRASVGRKWPLLAVLSAGAPNYCFIAIGCRTEAHCYPLNPYSMPHGEQENNTQIQWTCSNTQSRLKHNCKYARIQNNIWNRIWSDQSLRIQPPRACRSGLSGPLGMTHSGRRACPLQSRVGRDVMYSSPGTALDPESAHPTLGIRHQRHMVGFRLSMDESAPYVGFLFVALNIVLVVSK